MGADRNFVQMVEDLTRMTMERLQLYKKKNGKLPDKVIVFRDGVSEVCVSLCHDMYMIPT